MRLDKLSIAKFKNLRNFNIDFDEKSPTTVLVGENGTGKSNLLEAITLIFRDLDLGAPPAFKYEIKYYRRGNKINHRVDVDADPDRKDPVRISIDGESLSYNKFQEYSKNEETRYLPTGVFGYYSGPSDRMEEHYYKHQQQYYDAIIRSNERQRIRPLFYVQLVHGQFVLLSFFSKRDHAALNFLKKHLRISGLESVLFVMKEPPWQSKEGDPRFWNAGGTVQDFLGKLYPIALAPMRRTQTVKLDFRRTTKRERLNVLRKQKAERLRHVIRKAVEQLMASGVYISEARVKEYAKQHLPKLGRSILFKQALVEVKSEMGLLG